MDMLSMTFPPSSFTVVLDKCTMDALTTAEGSPWRPNAATRSAVAALLSSVSRVLSEGGRFVQVSFAQPHFRLRYLQRRGYRWRVTTQRLGEGVGAVYVYVMRKGADDAEEADYEESGWSDDDDDASGDAHERALSSDEEDVLSRIQLHEGD